MKHTRSSKVRLSTGDRVFGLVNGFFLVVLLLLILLPLVHMLAVSVSDANLVLRGEITFIPSGINFKCYEALLGGSEIPRAYYNTIRYTFFGVLIDVAMTALCAYPLSRPNFYGRKFFNFFVVFTMLFNVGIVANFMIVFQLGIKNTVWAILLPTAINVYYMVIMRTFFQNIPEELYQSAYVDGASDLRIFAQIILPISSPVIATMFLFYAVSHWNAYMPALLYLDHKELYPVQLILRNIVISGTVSDNATTDTAFMTQGIKYAAIFVTIAPILCVYPFVQKYFTKGIMVGSLKG
ncbi:MAG TPA: carbohydrate ABC transporter permease [Candidatus Onthenecus intestinigallinarum]|uniref:Carbohydrate ABC transporter permease n=1 Tax=Candidatus Onthenecus intestinigallinarum TaxID=2840875 RepID=A0A9D0ZB73_9FIRM|nr:carbohydrate ABC transporter permease [Candidatus Onthenecus intestinigallinarum]